MMKVYTIGSDEHIALIGRRLMVAGVVVLAYSIVKGTAQLARNKTAGAA